MNGLIKIRRKNKMKFKLQFEKSKISDELNIRDFEIYLEHKIMKILSKKTIETKYVVSKKFAIITITCSY